MEDYSVAPSHCNGVALTHLSDTLLLDEHGSSEGAQQQIDWDPRPEADRSSDTDKARLASLSLPHCGSVCRWCPVLIFLVSTCSTELMIAVLYRLGVPVFMEAATGTGRREGSEQTNAFCLKFVEHCCGRSISFGKQYKRFSSDSPRYLCQEIV